MRRVVNRVLDLLVIGMAGVMLAAVMGWAAWHIWFDTIAPLLDGLRG